MQEVWQGRITTLSPKEARSLGSDNMAKKGKAIFKYGCARCYHGFERKRKTCSNCGHKSVVRLTA